MLCAASSVRQRVVSTLRGRYKDVDVAEKAFNIDHDMEKSPCVSTEKILQSCKVLETKDLVFTADQIFQELVKRKELSIPHSNFIDLSLSAMENLKLHSKTNVLYKLAKIVATKRPDCDETLIPLNRMPWGLIQYQIDFFACQNINEVNFETLFSLSTRHYIYQ